MLEERVAQLEREVAELREAAQPKMQKVLFYTVDGQKEFQITPGFKVIGVVAKEKKEVGIEHISDPEKVDFVFNYHEGTLKPTRPIKEGSELVVITVPVS